MADNDMVLIIWRDACFREVLEPGAELGRGYGSGANKEWRNNATTMY